MAAVIVHGGAYTIPPVKVEPSLRGCEKAAAEAHRLLLSGKPALDAVEAAVRLLEDDPTFNAGRGSSLNMAGEIEMDAIIVDGKSLEFGAVAGVQNIANPISLARMVMEKTKHVMLAGKGANQFAREMGVPEVNPLELIGENSRKKWEDFSKFKTVVRDVYNNPPAEDDPKPESTSHETVGAVAIDLEGNLAAATSTGGITLKRVGRVGDVPLVGSGAYCDNTVGGVSTTGHGESIAKVVLAKRALSLLEFKEMAPQMALEQALEYMWKSVGGRGGMIMITGTGHIAKCFSTHGMAWASVNQNSVLESGFEAPKLQI